MVTDVLPAGVRLVSADAGCVLSGQTVSCAIGTVDSGASTVRHLTVAVLPAAAGTTLVNTATVSGGGVNPNQSGTTSSVRTGPIAGAPAAPPHGLAGTGLRLVGLLGAGALTLLAGLVLVTWYVRSRREV